VDVLRSPLARTALGSLLLAVPFVLVGWMGAASVPCLSRSIAAVLVGLTAPLASSEKALPEAASPAEAPSAGNAFEPVALTTTPRRTPKSRPAATPGAVSALFVPQAKVLALAQTAARPRGSFVTATSEHPAGLLLSGVDGLGIGVNDGDILIEALGVTPRSPGQIIALVVQARARKAQFLSGVLWRRGQLLRITVEQPYLSGAQPS